MLSGRFALSTSDGPGAVELLERARAAAERAARPELVREALTWLGVAHQALGEHAAATSAWLAAERIVDAASLNVPLGEGRGGFVGGTRGDATQRLVSHLLRVGDAEQAFAAARRGRRRALAGVTMQAVLASATPGQRQAWGAFLAEYRGERAELDAALAESWSWEQAEEEVRLQQLSVRRAALEGRFERSLSELGVDASAPSDETDVRPERGTLWLLWAPSADGWVGFAATDDGVTVLDLGPRLDDLGAWLLAPFDDAIEACEQVNVLLPAELSTVPVHGLSWRGAPLYEHRAVAYRVDAAPAAPASEPTHALVVSDADGNLPGSRAEGELVGAALQAQSLTVEARVGPGAVDPARLSELLSSTDHLHFAGHAVAEGPDGWESGLLLGRAVVGRRLVWSRFAPADVLALPAVPGSVVLSACSSGARVSGDAVGLGLARAFVLAGSRWAVGTTREVGDVEARAVAEAFYAEGLPASNAEAAGRLRAALRSVPQVADDYRLYIQ